MPRITPLTEVVPTSIARIVSVPTQHSPVSQQGFQHRSGPTAFLNAVAADDNAVRPSIGVLKLSPLRRVYVKRRKGRNAFDLGIRMLLFRFCTRYGQTTSPGAISRLLATRPVTIWCRLRPVNASRNPAPQSDRMVTVCGREGAFGWSGRYISKKNLRETAQTRVGQIAAIVHVPPCNST